MEERKRRSQPRSQQGEKPTTGGTQAEPRYGVFREPTATYTLLFFINYKQEQSYS